MDTNGYMWTQIATLNLVRNNGYFLSQDLTQIVWYFCVIVGEKVGEKVGENPRHECGYFDGYFVS